LEENESKTPKYRTPKKEVAVKVYTIAQESRYLIVYNVPRISVEDELIKLFALYGTIEEYRCMHEMEAEDEYCDVYWIKFSELPEARIAKRKVDDYNFFGKLLRVEYAPQNESIKDTRDKLDERKRVVNYRLNVLNKKPSPHSNNRDISESATLPFTELPFSAPNDGNQFPKSELEMLPAPNVSKSSGLYRRNAPNSDKQQENQQSTQNKKRKTPENEVDYFPVASMNYAASTIRNKLKRTIAPTVTTTNKTEDTPQSSTSNNTSKVSRRRI